VGPTCPAADLLLNRTGYLIRTRYDGHLGGDAYDILDAQTRANLGFASETKPSAPSKIVRTTFGRNLLLTSVEAFGADAQTRIFSVQELASVWSPRLVVNDAHAHPLCYFTGVFASIGGGFLIADRSGYRLGRVEIDMNESHYVLRGRMEQMIGWIAEARSTSSDCAIEYRVVIAQAAEPSRVANLLLLASTIALDIVYRERVGNA
jgi:hypothetical protein